MTTYPTVVARWIPFASLDGLGTLLEEIEFAATPNIKIVIAKLKTAVVKQAMPSHSNQFLRPTDLDGTLGLKGEAYGFFSFESSGIVWLAIVLLERQHAYMRTPIDNKRFANRCWSAVWIVNT